uniref:Uncharacterized protein n=1 Tax=Eutreptiella gymnastica TaxID=73025 RepID=A0A7S1IPY0_9EUGL|mmetsp:Transcript_3470/g.6011  ORF Transcript_3470/g.6011 Transcript_3470/m.6011 type:complete len:174 (+) Transcript_3470:432-953(+)
MCRGGVGGDMCTVWFLKPINQRYLSKKVQSSCEKPPLDPKFRQTLTANATAEDHPGVCHGQGVWAFVSLESCTGPHLQLDCKHWRPKLSLWLGWASPMQGPQICATLLRDPNTIPSTWENHCSVLGLTFGRFIMQNSDPCPDMEKHHQWRSSLPTSMPTATVEKWNGYFPCIS